MPDRTPSKNAIIYCLKSALQSTDWASIKSVLTDSKTILLAYRPNEGSDQYIVLIHELYDIDSNLN